MTNTALHLTRARLRTRRGEALASIAPLLLPRDHEKTVAAAHRIVWMLFQDAPPDPKGGGNDDWRAVENGGGFLWRDEGEGRYMILSRKQPSNPHGLFEVETKPFTPEIAAGTRLRFALRANPVIRLDQQETRRTAKDRITTKRKKVDVVMHALSAVPRTIWDNGTGRATSGRALERDRLVQETVTTWLARQGEKAGFGVPEGASADPWLDDDKDTGTKPLVTASNYTQVQIERRGAKGRRPAGISIVDIAGEIVVTDPAAFLRKLPLGFGSAKAFGCGLMLIRRA